MTMPDLWSVLHAPPIELLGWTLLHFVWQGILVAAVLAGALYLLRTHSPRVRYVVGCAALLGILALPVGTGMVISEHVLSAESPSSPSGSSVEGRTEVPAMSPVPSAAPSPSAAAWRTWIAGQVQPALPWIVVAWGVGVLVFAVRLGGGAWHVRRLRRSSQAVPAEWQDRLRRLADRMGVGASVALRQSDRVESPVLAGWWRPVILVPAGFLSGLPPKQVEALLLHELAHVRRRDVLVGRLQAMVETLLFFHPATWWISQQVRRAREACCDDLVVQAGSERTTYAQALAALAERAVEGTATTAWAPAATDGSLLDRIQRLVVPPEAPSTAGRRLSIVAAALLMVIVPVGLAACASQQSSTSATPSGTAASVAEETPPLQGREHRGSTIVSVRDDSSRRVITLRAPETVDIDSLDDGSYVLRYERGDADTLRIPHPEAFASLNVFGDERRSVPDSVRLAPHFPMRLGADSLGRVIVGDVNPDSLKRLIHARFSADSLKRVLRERFDLDSLKHRALQVQWQSDSLARSLRDRILDDEFDDWPADSTLDLDTFNREDFELDPGVESLLRRHEEHADSLRRHFEQLRERMEETRSETLREQARRLRERAERLEEQAKEMEEEQSSPPDEPQDPQSESG
jgi:beta-lactamase regulating signal transducer with metallopeptidase domain